MSAGHEHAKAALERARDAIDELILAADPLSGRIRGLEQARDRVSVELSNVEQWAAAEHSREHSERLAVESDGVDMEGLMLRHGHFTAHGYAIDRHGNGWILLDSDGAPLMIGDHGGVAPTKRDAVLEAYRRIEQEAS